MNNGKIKQILLNILLILLAFTVQNCVFPLLPFLAATPNLLLILTFSFGFIHGRNAGMFYGVFIWSAAGSFLQRAIWLLYADLRIHWLFQRYFYQILL